MAGLLRIVDDAGGRRKPLRTRLTKRVIAELPAPARGRLWVYDELLPRLCVSVTPGNAKSFYFVGRIRHRMTRLRIGTWPAMTIEQARDRVRKMTVTVDDGGDPAAERRAVRAELTFEALFLDYLAKHARLHKRTWRQDEQRYEQYLKRWGKRRIGDIRRPDVLALHASIGRSAPYQANRVHELIRKVFNFARAQGWTGDNPAVGIVRFKETGRERFLTAAELPRFFKALAQLGNRDLADVILLALLTGARRSNVLGARWPDIDLTSKVWTVPAADAKSGRAVPVVLVDAAVEMLKRRQAAHPDAEFVFPSWGKSGHLTEVKSAWKLVTRGANLEGLRFHDLRRTLGSWQAQAGVSELLIGLSLGHEPGSRATRVYSRVKDRERVAVGVNAAAQAILAAAGVKQPRPRDQRKRGNR